MAYITRPWQGISVAAAGTQTLREEEKRRGGMAKGYPEREAEAPECPACGSTDLELRGPTRVPVKCKECGKVLDVFAF
jgi:ribosomal protein L37AE/L43A